MHVFPWRGWILCGAEKCWGYGVGVYIYSQARCGLGWVISQGESHVCTRGLDRTKKERSFQSSFWEDATVGIQKASVLVRRHQL